jgi:2-polyprenyl-6-methoxyphenol hydroxylase-like FAD-dependent oxidoreductase
MNLQVLIVGAGPVGLVMAVELARYRIPVRIVDKFIAPAAPSRSSHLTTKFMPQISLLQTTCSPCELCGSPYPYALMLPQPD